MTSNAESIINMSKPSLDEAHGAGDVTSPDPSEKILCPHCRRTASNGIRCMGICVADNDY
jgi:hypothetical protein